MAFTTADKAKSINHYEHMKADEKKTREYQNMSFKKERLHNLRESVKDHLRIGRNGTAWKDSYTLEPTSDSYSYCTIYGRACRNSDTAACGMCGCKVDVAKATQNLPPTAEPKRRETEKNVNILIKIK